ncbi:proton-coupled amino acid transporter-like protein pathetic [Aphis gossypii]|uniref:Amino acid transporter transmembrane domain-containing protein n=1 Tax=Aphis gossypii TaxID=80765 RepID=A0A9P0NMT2_APHGO|nr:proton-coupled amino acid transporter-like protein pathetic [Aphis gossypii]XP_050063590.1 proton-coupled amino acid transporter-like protein pathetic [Aphis gossypii]CAH1732867.1 unnamed protein product [Aphis gossypii]
MDNPAAVLTDDVEDWSSRAPSAGSNQHQTHTRLSGGVNGSLPNNSSQTQSTPQQHYKRNASTYSIDIPATLGLMVSSGNPAANGSTTSSTMKLTEYSSSGSNSSNSGSVGDGTATANSYIISGGNGAKADGNGKVGGRRRKGGKKQPRYDPFEMRDKSKATTDSGALLHLVKSSLGSGILAMPNAFKNGGLIFGLVGTAAIGALCTHCIYLLVLCSQTLARRTRRPYLGFADTAAAAFSTGPRRFRAWAPFAKEFVNAALFCTYYFGNTVYVVLVAASFKQVADTHTDPEWHMSIRAWILGLAVPLVPLGIIRSLRLLVPFSAIATAFILVGLGCTMSWVVTGVSLFADESALTAAVPLPDIGSRPWIAPVGHMPLFFATVLFAMEGIGTVLPIENSMRHPKRFLTARPCGVLNAAMTLVVCLYSVAGFLGYLRFGDATDGSITLNLPNDLFAESVKIMVALSILFSYGLQFCVPSEIVWVRLEPWLQKRKQNDKYSADGKFTTSSTPTVTTIAGSTMSTATAVTTTSAPSVDEKKQLEIESNQQVKPITGEYYIMRAAMILGTVLIAALVPDLAPFISLIGAVFFSILGLMCPAVIHLVAFWNHGNENGEDTDDETDSEDDLDFDGDYYAVEDDTDLEAVQRQPQRRRSSGRSTRRRRKGMDRWTVAKDVAIVLIALIALVSGTYASLVDIVAFYGGESGGHHEAGAVNGTATTTIGPGPESAFLVAVDGGH